MGENKQKSKGAPKKGNENISLLEKITPLAQEVNCLDIERIAKVCIKKIPKLISVELASLYILDRSNRILHLQKCNHPFLINRIVSLNQKPPSPMVMAVTSNELILTSNIDTHNRPIIKRSQRNFARNYKTKNCAIAPLVCQDNIVGVLNLADKTDGSEFTKEDIVLIELFSQLVGASLGNIKMFEKIQHQAIRDGLTGLYNHKRFYEILERELWRNRRYGGQISLIMIDIDDLKKVNDAHGHRAGDKVIKKVSSKIQGCIRQIDIAARYGGDEFAVILPNTSLADARHVAERMLEAVSKSSLFWKREPIKPSISIGLGEYGPEITPEDITNRSDKALYMAKQSGKNTVKVIEPVTG